MSNRKVNVHLAHVGFCSGVQRADSMISKIREEEKEDIYVLGELIHNPIYNEILKEDRIYHINSIDEADDKIVLIRTHGLSPENEKLLHSKAKKVYDLTCPLVKMIHKKAKKYSDEGYFILITGKKDHPEVLGTQGHIQNYFIFKDKEELKEINLDEFDKVVLISQSTFSQDSFLSIAEFLKTLREDIIIDNTLCYAPKERQTEMTNFAKENDTIIVIGGKNSSNTKELYNKALKESLTKQVYCIEYPSEVKKIDLKKSFNVGIASGTSTPNFLIEELVSYINDLSSE